MILLVLDEQFKALIQLKEASEKPFRTLLFCSLFWFTRETLIVSAPLLCLCALCVLRDNEDGAQLVCWVLVLVFS